MTTFNETATQFANALVQRDYSLAHSLLADALKGELPPDQLQARYEGMIAAYGNPAQAAEVMETLTDWPDKQPGDLGWAYVAISGENFSEAVTLTLADQGGQPAIREIVWGRP
jgi:hypothetical protein